ncbi:glutamate-rich WD repeat-containing protein 1 [Tanacetum coccineum]
MSVVENIVVVMIVVKKMAVVMIVVKKSVVAYFLDSCNLGSRIVDFDDTPIVIDKHVRAVTFAFHKGETVATSLSVGNLGCGEGVSFWLVAKDDGVVARYMAKSRRRGEPISLPHPTYGDTRIDIEGYVNRIRTMTQRPHICATWGDIGHVQIWDFSTHLNALAESETNISKDAIIVSSQTPLVKFTGHKNKGYAIDWSTQFDIL